MIVAIAQRELIEQWRDGRFGWSLAVFALLFALALATGWQRFEAASDARAAADRISYDSWLEQGEKNPHAAAHYGHFAFKQQNAFSFLDRGLNDFAGTSIWLEAHYQNLAEDRRAQDFATVDRLATLTGAFALQYLMPLMVILLAFDSFAGERERGTLRQLLSLGVAPRRLMLGKLLGTAGAIGLVVLPVTALGCIVLAVADGGTADSFARAGLMFLVYAGYAAIWLALTLAASASCRTGQAALILLLGFWALSSFVVPRIAADISRTLVATPSLVAFEAAIKADTAVAADGETQQQFIGRKTRDLLAEYGVSSPRDLPINMQGLMFTWLEDWGNRVFDTHFGALQDRFEQQQAIQQAFALVSPLIAVRQMSMAIAGSDLTGHAAFAVAAEQFRRDFIAEMNTNLTENSRTGDARYSAGRELWATVEPFAYRPPAPLAALAVQGPALVLFALWLVGGLIVATGRIGRLNAEG